MVKKRGSVNPLKHPTETFQLYSIPSYDIGKPEILKGNEIGSSKKLIAKNDVLLSRIVPHIRRCWVVEDDSKYRRIGSGEWMIFNSEKIHPSYLKFFFLSDSFTAQFLKDLRGVGGSLLRANPGITGKIQIPLPPLLTQRRIAAILDQAEALRRKDQELLAKYDELTGSVFLEMFGDPALNPMKWPRKKLSEIAIKFSDGPFGSNLKTSHYTKSGIRVIRLQNIGVGEFIDNDQAFVSEDYYKTTLLKHTCVNGDVLIGTMGTPNLRACLFPDFIEKAINKADCLQLRPDTKIVSGEFLVNLLNTEAVQALVSNFIHGQTRERISKGQLSKLGIPIPPIELQRKFNFVVNNIKAQKDKVKDQIEKSEMLFRALLQKAFKGNLIK